ncbi:MAG TPA: zinc-binding dehydrogenase [Blastocatellia bacterium]|nr:zinc-binding dehydrogenase [Blastocatellia bacterium]
MSTKNIYVSFSGPGQVELRESAIPIPGPGEVLIHTTRTLISTGTEMTLLIGAESKNSVWGELTSYPLTPGYCNVGVVIDAADSAGQGLIGKRVGSHSPHAAYVVWPASDLRIIPDNVTDDDAAFSTLAEVTMNGLRRARLIWGESVAVVGLGLLGQLCARLCEVAGAVGVFGVDLLERRISLLPDSQCITGLCGAPSAVRDVLIEKNRGRLADLVVELTGYSQAIPEEFLLLRPQGRFLVLGSPRGQTLFDFHDLCNRPSFEIIGSHGFSHPQHETPDNPWTKRRHGELFLDLVATGRLPVSGLISHEFAFDKAALAYDLLSRDRDQAMGVILEWDK